MRHPQPLQMRLSKSRALHNRLRAETPTARRTAPARGKRPIRKRSRQPRLWGLKHRKAKHQPNRHRRLRANPHPATHLQTVKTAPQTAVSRALTKTVSARAIPKQMRRMPKAANQLRRKNYRRKNHRPRWIRPAKSIHRKKPRRAVAEVATLDIKHANGQPMQPRPALHNRRQRPRQKMVKT